MEKFEKKKPKWRSTINFTDGISISQNIFSKDIIKFVKKQNKDILASVDKVHTYVFPYVLHEARKQDQDIANIAIREET